MAAELASAVGTELCLALLTVRRVGDHLVQDVPGPLHLHDLSLDTNPFTL
jgi:hypothetical protein